MRILLSIETTGRHLGLSLYSIDPIKKKWKRLSTHFSEASHRQSDLLFPTLNRMMKMKKLKASDIRFIAVDVGPGSFTGVRVGVASARAMAQGLKAELIGLTSLEMMAHAEYKKKSAEGRWVVPSLFALEGEVYGAVYASQAGVLKTILKPRWCSKNEFSDALQKLKSSRHGPALIHIDEPPHPDSLAELALQKIFKTEKSFRFNYNEIEPLYLQPSWAERKKIRE